MVSLTVCINLAHAQLVGLQVRGTCTTDSTNTHVTTQKVHQCMIAAIPDKRVGIFIKPACLRMTGQ
jgi:hypothetical protein